ncbi:MAG: hypothetical protein FJZ56_01040 [Chlamydiae bacterium]|nr:hypothetical protein [Chlamydiota bacterium]
MSKKTSFSKVMKKIKKVFSSKKSRGDKRSGQVLPYEPNYVMELENLIQTIEALAEKTPFVPNKQMMLEQLIEALAEKTPFVPNKQMMLEQLIEALAKKTPFVPNKQMMLEQLIEALAEKTPFVPNKQMMLEQLIEALAERKQCANECEGATSGCKIKHCRKHHNSMIGKLIQKIEDQGADKRLDDIKACVKCYQVSTDQTQLSCNKVCKAAYSRRIKN